MRKSVTGFVCGLIGSLFSLWWGFWVGVIGNIGTLLSSATGSGADGTITVLYLLGWVGFIGAIFGIVGASNCFKKARAGAIWLTIATAMCGSLQLYLFFSLTGDFAALLLTRVVIFLLPAILLAVATIFAWIAKKVEVPEGNNSYSSIANNVNKTKEDDSALERELLNLKKTLDKGLITEDEYQAARKKIIEKYM